jgi:hypothetical protein
LKRNCDVITLVWLVVAAAVALVGCTSIRIESGDISETGSDRAEVTARQIRSDWYAQIERAQPLQMAELLRVHIDSTTALLIRYGFSIADQWRNGNDLRGEDIPAAEMQQMVEAGIAAERPILDAYEDNTEYALDRIREKHFFDPVMLDQIQTMTDLYDQAYSVVFYPEDDVRGYENRLYDTRAAIESQSKELAAKLQRF